MQCNKDKDQDVFILYCSDKQEFLDVNEMGSVSTSKDFVKDTPSDCDPATIKELIEGLMKSISFAELVDSEDHTSEVIEWINGLYFVPVDEDNKPMFTHSVICSEMINVELQYSIFKSGMLHVDRGITSKYYVNTVSYSVGTGKSKWAELQKHMGLNITS